jgi:hypothetical protein
LSPGTARKKKNKHPKQKGTISLYLAKNVPLGLGQRIGTTQELRKHHAGPGLLRH